MIFLYRVLIAPLAVLLLPFAALFNPKIAAGLRLRRSPRSCPEFSQRPVWIHASSGEFEYAKSVIRELKVRYPAVPVVVTYFSPTYAKNVQNFAGVDFALPLPLDLPGPVRGFLRRVNPRVLLLARTDFWPELLSQARARGIPTQVFSYTQKSTAEASRLARAMGRWRLGLVDRIACVSAEDKASVEALGVKTPVEPLGDTRYDQVKFRLDHPKELPNRLKPRDEVPVLVAGSTWAEDEQVVLPAVQTLLSEGRLRLILTPHEPTAAHIHELAAQMRRHKIAHVLFSTAQTWPADHVLLVDQVGWLAELYAWGDLALIGGSFAKSVHSVMEALGAGLRTFVGPHHTNNREAIEFQKVRRAVTVVKNAEELRRALVDLSPGELKVFKSELKIEFGARLGATNKLIESIRPIMSL